MSRAHLFNLLDGSDSFTLRVNLELAPVRHCLWIIVELATVYRERFRADLSRLRQLGRRLRGKTIFKVFFPETASP